MISNEQISSVVRLLQAAQRPLFIWGSGVRQQASQAHALAHSLGIPVACTWGAIDLIHHDDPLFAGGFGTHGTRAANFAVQNSDLLISIGSRLDTKATGAPSTFARNARIVMVDLDQAELDKFNQLGRKIDVPICADAGEFIEKLNKAKTIECQMNDRYEWQHTIQRWRKHYDTHVVSWPGINPYELMKEIGKWTTPDDIIVSDTGTVLGYIMQGFPFKGERFLHAFNMTPMGWGLPAAVGSTLATGKRSVLITGDGSLMMSIAELATVARWNLNIKIILLNNQGHNMCKQTERQWFDGKHASTTIESGLGFPEDWTDVVRGFGIESYANNTSGWATLFGYAEPGFMELEISPDAYLIPQARFGQPIEDQDPPLDREEFRQQMIVPPL